MRLALIGLAILSCTSACSEKPVEAPKSRFTQQGLDAIAKGCGLPDGSLTLEGANSVHFGAAVFRDYKMLNCVQTKIRDIYYPGALVGTKKTQPEGKDAQTH